MRTLALPWAVLALVTIGLAVPAVRHLREQPPSPPPPVRLTFSAPPGADLGSGDEALDAAISPDERRVAFVATRAGTVALWVRQLEADRAERFDGTDGAQSPAWSPNGDAVSFFADGRLRMLSLSDGGVTDLADAPSPVGAAWLPDGSLVFAPEAQGGLQRLRDGVVSAATQLGPRDRAHVFPTSAGDADQFAYTAVRDDGRRTVRLVRNGQEHDLTSTSGHGQVVDGYLLHVRDDILLAQPVDPSRGSFQGRAVPLSSGVGVTPAGRGLFVASSGIVLTSPAAVRARELAWFDFAGRRTGTIGEAGEFWQVRLSPDDRYAAVTLVAPLLRTLDITVMSTDGSGSAEPLTRAVAADSDPVWAPDGRRLVFRSLQAGRPGLFITRAQDRDTVDEPLLEGDLTPTDWRGSVLLFHAPEPGSGYDIWSVHSSSRERATVEKSGFNDTDGRRSPDGEWLAYVSDESGRPDIYARRWPSGERVRVSSAGGSRPRWSRDGQSIFFLRGSSILRAARQRSTSAGFSPGAPVLDAPGLRDFDVASRRDALLALVPVDRQSEAPVAVVLNWKSILESGPPRE